MLQKLLILLQDSKGSTIALINGQGYSDVTLVYTCAAECR